MQIPLKGDLKDYSLPKILIALKREKVTGTLFITAPHLAKNIYIKDGDAIFASSSLEEDRLGRLLVREGKLTEEQYNSSFELLSKTTGKRHGTVLVERGFITPNQLVWGVKYQVREIILSLILLEAGVYEFEEGLLHSNEVITLHMDTGSLIYEAGSRTDNLAGIKEELPEPETVFVLFEDTADMFKQTELSERDKRILSHVDGKRTIRQLVEESPLDSSEAQKALYALWRANIIVKTEKPLSKEDDVLIEDATENMSEEEVALKEKIDRLYDKVKTISAAELLQIDEQMTSSDVKKKYHLLAKEFHPDRAYNLKSKEFRDKLTFIFGAMANAYGLLRDDAKRRQYFSTLKKLPLRQENAGSLPLKDQMNRGIQELKNGNYTEAADIFKWLSSQGPEEPNYWGYLSLALSRAQGRLKEAETAILKALALDPLNSEYVTNLASIYQKAGLKARAKAQFEKALKLDTENTAAKKGLAEVTQPE